jgi:CRP/FNR family transcriptional regulator, cyclic AMP receptor protein
MTLTAEQLACIPLFAGLSERRLAQLTSIFEPLKADEGAVLFEVAGPATHFFLLTAGEVTIYEGEQIRCQLWPPATIGELGCLAGVARVTRAVVSRPSEIWRTSQQSILGFFDQHTDIALPFFQQLVNLIADKVRRDQTRLEDMRRNIIRTQKAMKQMRDFVLESQDTPISETLHNRLEDMIRHNRRINYRVEPPEGAAAVLRFDSGAQAQVVEISRTHLSYRRTAEAAPPEGTRQSAVLSLSGPEIPVSGTVLRTIDDRVDLELDLLLDEYGSTLDGYLTRLQLLDIML